MITIQIFNRSQQIIGLLFLITIFVIHPTKARNITTDNSGPLRLSVSCPDNPRCIYSKNNTLQLNISIQNKTHQDLYIPLEAMHHLKTSFSFKDVRNGKTMNIPDPSWTQPLILFKKLTLLPADGSLIISTLYVISEDKGINNIHTNHIIFSCKTITPAYIQDSKQPIGSYKNGKFEPKQFILDTEKMITKK